MPFLPFLPKVTNLCLEARVFLPVPNLFLLRLGTQESSNGAVWTPMFLPFLPFYTRGRVGEYKKGVGGYMGVLVGK